jgi:hypothetical protein
VTEDQATIQPRRGDRLVGRTGRSIGRVDAVFADYLLVRSGWLLPVDLYVPREAITVTPDGQLQVAVDRRAAYDAWHRPLKRAPHD